MPTPLQWPCLCLVTSFGIDYREEEENMHILVGRLYVERLLGTLGSEVKDMRQKNVWVNHLMLFTCQLSRTSDKVRDT